MLRFVKEIPVVSMGLAAGISDMIFFMIGAKTPMFPKRIFMGKDI